MKQAKHQEETILSIKSILDFANDLEDDNLLREVQNIKARYDKLEENLQ